MKRVLIFYIIFIGTLIKALSQSKKDLPSPVNNHYSGRTDKFNKEPVMENCILFLGNSITEMGQWQKYFPDKRILNRGISGDVTSGVVKRLQEVVRHNPEKIFIKIGINDLTNNVNEEVINSNYLKIIHYLKENSPSSNIYIQSILPVTKKLLYHNKNQDIDNAIIKINKNLIKMAKEQDVNYIDLYRVFVVNEMELNSRYTYDGLHLNEEGYQRWVTLLKDEKFIY